MEIVEGNFRVQWAVASPIGSINGLADSPIIMYTVRNSQAEIDQIHRAGNGDHVSWSHPTLTVNHSAFIDKLQIQLNHSKIVKLLLQVSPATALTEPTEYGSSVLALVIHTQS